jgi:hypothetical protein
MAETLDTDTFLLQVVGVGGTVVISSRAGLNRPGLNN